MNLATVIDGHPADAPALISDRGTTSYGELGDLVGRLRGGFAGLGLRIGERVGIVCENNEYFVTTYLAITGAGLVAVPLNPAAPRPALVSELGSVGARAVVVGPNAQPNFGDIGPTDVPGLEWIIDCENVAPGHLGLEELVGDVVPIVDRASHDLAALMFTSGTAGSPKAAKLSHGNLLSNLDQQSRRKGLAITDRDVLFGVLPFFHIFGLNVTLNATLRYGGSLVLMDRFDAAAAVEAIATHRVTVLAGPPTMWALLADLPGVTPAAFESVRIAASGAAPLPAATYDRALANLGLQVYEGYGLTETSPAVTSGIGLEMRIGSIGRPLPGNEVRLVDGSGEDVYVGDRGEVWVRGPNVFSGYWEDDAATVEVITEAGWLRTGDVAVVDDDGYLYLVDRIKDLIIVSGFNVYPAEVERVLLGHPGVKGVAVVGFDHEHSGEAVRAYVRAETTDPPTEEELLAFCRERLATYRCPAEIVFVDAIPEGVAGKVIRRELRGSRRRGAPGRT